MKVFRKRPGEPWEAIEVENSLEALQREVDGYIDAVPIATDACIICDEEGRIKGKPVNCRCPVALSELHGDFYGTILLAGVDGEEFCDVPDAALEYKPKTSDMEPEKEGELK